MHLPTFKESTFADTFQCVKNMPKMKYHDLRHEDNLQNGDQLKNEDSLTNENDLKSEDTLKIEDYLKD